MWDLPGPGIEPVSAALAGGLLPLYHQGSAVAPFCEVWLLVVNAPLVAEPGL